MIDLRRCFWFDILVKKKHKKKREVMTEGSTREDENGHGRRPLNTSVYHCEADDAP